LLPEGHVVYAAPQAKGEDLFVDLNNNMKTVSSKSTWIALSLFIVLSVNADWVGKDAIDTSIVRLLSNPESYNGKTIAVVGYYSIGQELSAIFLSKEAADLGNIQLSVWVNIPDKLEATDLIAPMKDGFVYLRGVFEYDPKNGAGHLSTYPARITHLTLFRPLKRP
jgi:hypothetical protein